MVGAQAGFGEADEFAGGALTVRCFRDARAGA
jgi:hypothetical protein